MKKTISYLLIILMMATMILTTSVTALGANDNKNTKIHLHIGGNVAVESVTVVINGEENSMEQNGSSSLFTYTDDGEFATNGLEGFWLVIAGEPEFFGSNKFDLGTEANGTLNCSITLNSPTPTPTATPTATPTTAPTATPTATPTTAPTATPTTAPTATPTTAPTATPTTTPVPTTTPTATVAPVPTETPTTTTTPEPTKTPKPEKTPKPTATPKDTDIEDKELPGGPAVTPKPTQGETEVLLDEEPVGAPAALPKTSGIPAEIFYSLGFVTTASGLLIKKRKK